jgi:hypothetical protein
MNTRVYGCFQLYVWGFQGLLLTLFCFAGPPPIEWFYVVWEVARLLVLALVSCGIIHIAVKFKWFSLTRAQLFVRAGVACVLGSVPATAVSYQFSRYYHDPVFPWSTSGDLCYNAVLLLVWGALFSSFHLYRINRALELNQAQMAAASKGAQLAALTNQINPHFLFNSFSLLRVLVQRDPGVSSDAILSLSEMMRHSLTTASKETISLAEEIGFLDRYLFLECLRFEDRLRITREVPDDLMRERIPPMLLHTLVQNAIKHGIDQDTSGLDISYRVNKEGAKMKLIVVNTGRLSDAASDTGTGLNNARTRLKLLYGDQASLTLCQQGTVVVAESHWPSNQNPDESLVGR